MFNVCNCSTRVSNELGAGHPEAARLVVCVVLVMAVTEGILVGSVLILIRNVWGYAYSNEIEVVKYVASMLPILAASNFLDGLQCVLSGFFFFFASLNFYDANRIKFLIETSSLKYDVWQVNV